MNEAFSHCTCVGHQLNCCNIGSENQEVIARRAGNLSGLSRLPDGYMPYVLPGAHDQEPPYVLYP